jgi:hypothetical protein
MWTGARGAIVSWCLTSLLLSPIGADAGAIDEYAGQAFGETGCAWLVKSFRKLGPYMVVDVVPDRPIGIQAAQLTIDGGGELYGVTVQYGSKAEPRPPLVRVR